MGLMNLTKQRQSLGQRLFINRDFGLLFLGRLVSQIGDGIHYLVLTWFVLDLTGSGTALGTMLFASSIPAVILAPFSGVLADTWNRKTIIVSMDIVRGLIMIVLAVIFQAGALTMPVLYVATIFSSLASVLFGPAISASIPNLVGQDELVKANSLNNLSRGATMIIGPLVGSILLALGGYFGVFLVTGISFLLSAVSEMFIRFPKIAAAEENVENISAGQEFFNKLREGFVYIWNNTGLKMLVFYALIVNFLAAPLMGVVVPYLGKEIFKFEAQHFGMVQAAVPAGFIVGTLFMGYLTKKYGKGFLLALGISSQGIIAVLLGLGALPRFYGSVSFLVLFYSMSIAMLIVGVLNTLVNVPLQVMLQETVPDIFRGRVYGLMDGMVQVLTPISLASSGVLVDNFTMTGILIFVGLLIAIVGLCLGASRSIRELYGEKVVV